MRTPDELTDLFRERSRKVTPQRQSIFRALHRLDGAHPTAEIVYDAVAAEMPTISLKTVYQTLHDLAALGEVVQLDLGTGSYRFDTELEPHHHLVCEGCGRVRDVRVELTDVSLPSELEEPFHVTSTEVVFRGTCEACTDPTAVTTQ